MKETIQKLLQQEAKAILGIPDINPFEEAVRLLYDAVHVKKGKVVASGMGKAGQIGHNIATTLSSTGTPSGFIHAAEAQHGDLGFIQENDVLLLISNSGKTREIVELVELARRLHENQKIIVITSSSVSPLAQTADCVLLTGPAPEICPLGLTPTTSTTMMTVIGDILVVLLMEKIGFTKNEYAKRHHGGYLGEKAKT